MSRENTIGDTLIPGLFVLFVFSLLLLWLTDWIGGRYGLCRQVWNSSLFRLALLVCAFYGLVVESRNLPHHLCNLLDAPFDENCQH